MDTILTVALVVFGFAVGVPVVTVASHFVGKRLARRSTEDVKAPVVHGRGYGCGPDEEVIDGRD